ncbi:MAG: hypothetical protein M1816_001720 [Peltula sp. TS41687]|nr:MAG: hypothetical protein M1816_001720 [Peltula sp. TS41687]
MASSYGLCGDGLIDIGFDSRSSRYPFHSRPTPSTPSWPVSMPMTMEQTLPHHQTTAAAAFTAVTEAVGSMAAATAFGTLDESTTALLAEWPMDSIYQAQYRTTATSLPPQVSTSYNVQLPTGSMEYLSPQQPHHQPHESAVGSGLSLEAHLMAMEAQSSALQGSWDDFQTGLIALAGHHALSHQALAQANLPDSSPTETSLEARSLTSSSSDHGWTTIDHHHSSGAIFNPSETLHPRSYSDSSNSDVTGCIRNSFDTLDDLTHPPISPSSDVHVDVSLPFNYSPGNHSPSAAVDPMPIHSASTSPRRIPSSQGGNSPPSRRPARKSPTTKASKPVISRPQSGRKDTEKRVGRRRGPLNPDQRKQAGEIRKLGACLRCKFLKKMCNKGEPCAGCKPSHARLWQVPCTRIDIKDVAYFMKDWKADFERHVSLGFSVGNIKGFSQVERVLYITHGYGVALPVTVREVSVRDDRCFVMDWVESAHETPRAFVVSTARLSAGMDGISPAVLDEYVDKHLDGGFEQWVDDFFEGTPFLTEILKTAYRYYLREQLPVIRKALKLVLAYNLTMHITMVQCLSDEDNLPGKVTEKSSRYQGKTLAPVMINFQIKCALAEMWRELQKEVLEELSVLYSSVYTERMKNFPKNWPVIFLLAAILLAIWEEMQFDCHYRVPDDSAVRKFCDEMENVPVGIIVGLFSAISQKLPAFSEWDTQKHHDLLNSNGAACAAMSEVREHVTKYDTYLRTRSEAKFDKRDFNCLSNKFLSKLVIRAN